MESITLECVIKDGIAVPIGIINGHNKARKCPRCGVDISNRARNAIYCTKCAK